MRRPRRTEASKVLRVESWPGAMPHGPVTRGIRTGQKKWETAMTKRIWNLTFLLVMMEVTGKLGGGTYQISQCQSLMPHTPYTHLYSVSLHAPLHTSIHHTHTQPYSTLLHTIPIAHHYTPHIHIPTQQPYIETAHSDIHTSLYILLQHTSTSYPCSPLYTHPAAFLYTTLTSHPYHTPLQHSHIYTLQLAPRETPTAHPTQHIPICMPLQPDPYRTFLHTCPYTQHTPTSHLFTIPTHIFTQPYIPPHTQVSLHFTPITCLHTLAHLYTHTPFISPTHTPAYIYITCTSACISLCITHISDIYLPHYTQLHTHSLVSAHQSVTPGLVQDAILGSVLCPILDL